MAEPPPFAVPEHAGEAMPQAPVPGAVALGGLYVDLARTASPARRAQQIRPQRRQRQAAGHATGAARTPARGVAVLQPELGPPLTVFERSALQLGHGAAGPHEDQCAWLIADRGSEAAPQPIGQVDILADSKR